MSSVNGGNPVIRCWFCGLDGVSDPCQDCRGTALSGSGGFTRS